MSRKVVVVDTNCWVSSYLFPDGKPSQATRRVLDAYTVAHSQATIAELSDVLRRKRFDGNAPLEERLRFTANVAASAQIIEPIYHITYCDDPKDDKFLDLAYSSAATCIISGDRDLLKIKHFMGIQIWTPAQLLERELARDSELPTLPDQV
jgi:putative PIN family toxin of toxin-antitoxin system